MVFFRSVQNDTAIFRNALQKNALKIFILNIHEFKVSIQTRENACKIQFLVLSLVRALLFWLPLCYHIKKSDVKRC